MYIDVYIYTYIYIHVYMHMCIFMYVHERYFHKHSSIHYTCAHAYTTHKLICNSYAIELQIYTFIVCT